LGKADFAWKQAESRLVIPRLSRSGCSGYPAEPADRSNRTSACQ